MIAQQQYEEEEVSQPEAVQPEGFHMTRTAWIVIGVVVVLGGLAYYLIQRYSANNSTATATSSGSGGSGTTLPLASSAGTSEGSASQSGTVTPNAPSTGSGIIGETASSAGNSSVETIAGPGGAQATTVQTVQGTPLPSATVTPQAGTATTVTAPGSSVPIPAQSYTVTTPQGTGSYVATPGGMVEGTGAGAMALSQALGLQQYMKNHP